MSAGDPSAAVERTAGLERANAALREANAALTRSAFARADAGGASALTAVRELETERDALRADLAAAEALVLELEEIARRNDAMFQQQRAWNAAKRYRLADQVATAASRARSAPRQLLRRDRG